MSTLARNILRLFLGWVVSRARPPELCRARTGDAVRSCRFAEAAHQLGQDLPDFEGELEICLI